jgi:hypothetical protein
MICNINSWEDREKILFLWLIEIKLAIKPMNLLKISLQRILVWVLVGGGHLKSQELSVIGDIVGPVGFDIIKWNLSNGRWV